MSGSGRGAPGGFGSPLAVAPFTRKVSPAGTTTSGRTRTFSASGRTTLLGPRYWRLLPVSEIGSVLVLRSSTKSFSKVAIVLPPPPYTSLMTRPGPAAWAGTEVARTASGAAIRPSSVGATSPRGRVVLNSTGDLTVESWGTGGGARRYSQRATPKACPKLGTLRALLADLWVMSGRGGRAVAAEVEPARAMRAWRSGTERDPGDVPDFGDGRLDEPRGTGRCSIATKDPGTHRRSPAGTACSASGRAHAPHRCDGRARKLGARTISPPSRCARSCPARRDRHRSTRS